MDPEIKKTKLQGISQLLRSLVESSKDGVLITKLQAEYRGLVGTAIPFRELGYSSLEALIRDIPATLQITRSNSGEIIVKAVTSETTVHLTKLISKQHTKGKHKKPTRKLNSSSRSWYTYGHNAPNKRFNIHSGHTTHTHSNYNHQQTTSRYATNTATNIHKSQSKPSYRVAVTPPRFNKQLRSAEMWDQTPDPTKNTTEVPRKSALNRLGPNPNTQSQNSSKEIKSSVKKEETLNPASSDYWSRSNRNLERLNENPVPKNNAFNGSILAPQLGNHTLNGDVLHNEWRKSTRDLIGTLDLENCSTLSNHLLDTGHNPAMVHQSIDPAYKEAVNIKPLWEMNYSPESLTPPISADNVTSAFKSLNPRYQNPCLQAEGIGDTAVGNAHKKYPAKGTSACRTWKFEDSPPEPLNVLYPSSITPPIGPGGMISPEVNSKGFLMPSTNKELILAFAASKGVKAEFKSMLDKSKNSKKKTYLSTLMLLDKKYLSYPAEMKTQEDADEEAAKNAVEKLNLRESNFNEADLPVCSVNTYEDINLMIERITKIVQPKSTGIWHLNVEARYKEAHKESLPENWISHLKLAKELKCETVESVVGDSGTKRYIIYPQTPVHTDSPANTVDDSSSCASKSPEPSEAAGSTEEDTLEVYISHIENSAEVYYQLLEFSDSFEKLSLQMEDFYSKEEFLPPLVQEGEMYCLVTDDGCFRVLVENVLDLTKEVKCCFLDHGDKDIVSQSSLRRIHKEFLELPVQANRCQLTGLDLFYNQEGTTKKLMEMASNKSLIAQVTDRDHIITATLYDTSTEVDVNINKVVLDYTLSELMMPSLPGVDEFTEAIVTSVSDNGNITVQAGGPGKNIINELLESLKEELEDYIGSVKKFSLSELYAFKSENGSWHRIVVLNTIILDGGKVSARFIDSGQAELVDARKVCSLNEISDVLVGMQGQGIVCQLNMAFMNKRHFKWDPRATHAFLKSLPHDQKVLLKVKESANNLECAKVDIYKREKRDLVWLNESLYQELQD